jgi:hypothetical protein
MASLLLVMRRDLLPVESTAWSANPSRVELDPLPSSGPRCRRSGAPPRWSESRVRTSAEAHNGASIPLWDMLLGVPSYAS